MRDLSKRGMLKDIPEQYLQSINNTIQNLLYYSEKTVVGESGQEKGITEILGKLWDMSPEEAIACVEGELSSGRIQDKEVVSLLQDFMVTKQLIPSGYESSADSYMPPEEEYAKVHSEWKSQFVGHSKHCHSVEDLYKKVDEISGLRGESDYFFKKYKYNQLTNKLFSEEYQEQSFVDGIQKRIRELEMSAQHENGDGGMGNA